MLLLSRPYGLFLDACRRLAGTAPPAGSHQSRG
jgi:hypothetical protein